MATNNAINLKSSGIVSYDGAGTFSALANPLTVPNGGSGVSSTTAYAVLCGGTTSTGNIQSIASVGSSTNVLTSNGAGALPTFQASSGGSSPLVFFVSTLTGSPVGGINNFWAYGISFAAAVNSSNSNTKIYMPITGTIDKVYGTITVQGTLGSTENCTLYFRLNDTTDTTVTSTLKCSTANNTFNNTALGMSVTAGDYIQIKFLPASWSTTPTTVAASLSFTLA